MCIFIVNRQKNFFTSRWILSIPWIFDTVFRAFCLGFTQDWLFLCHLCLVVEKNIKLIFLKFRNNFVKYIILLYVNLYKLWCITIHCILSNFFSIFYFPIRIHVEKPKSKSAIFFKLVNQFRLNFAEGFGIAQKAMPQNSFSFRLFG